jgi:methyl-accepting chemotaxis protein
MRNLGIGTKMALLIGFFAVGFGIFIFNVHRAMKPKLEDSAYKRVVVLKDVVADVLPPPKYVLESYLVLLQMAVETDPEVAKSLATRWGQLRTEYNARQEYWPNELPDGPLKTELLDTSHRSAIEFLDTADAEVVPAINSGDRKKAIELLDGKMQDIYQRHRASIDNVVAIATKDSAESIEEAAATIGGQKSQLAVIGVTIALIGCAVGLFIARNIIRRLNETVNALSAVAEGDFTTDVEDESTDEIGRMSDALRRAVGSIRQTLSEVRGVAEAVANASSELSAAGNSISNGAQRQASQLEETAASLEEITSTVKQNAENAGAASKLASNARDIAETGGRVVGDTVGAMTEINSSSKKIADIITTIDEIAFQTNLLALNAAVEAARAGEQGRGFAVVASEVRNLAQRSAGAAKEIKTLIQDSVKKVDAGSSLVEQSGRTLKEIVTSVKRVTDIVAEIAAATREQSSGIDQVNGAVGEMDSVTQSNASQTEELAATAESLAHQANDLQKLVRRFRLSSDEERPVDVRRVRDERRAAQRSHAPAPAEENCPVGASSGSGRGFEEF